MLTERARWVAAEVGDGENERERGDKGCRRRCDRRATGTTLIEGERAANARNGTMGMREA
ncbi:hypothetical protein L484_021053 [Morus notabilis]|uniref:Uncharacterized protein n=1 Tax=Morus notabilis TaxID=981085 RepID=W9RPS4_9ROSA|nr:hypothetical protein L484_021053 [Morus notabilis]